MLKYTTIKVISLRDFDSLVRNTYNKPYSFQQQMGCQPRGMFDISVPCEWAEDDEEEMNDSIPEKVNGDEMGVKFQVWLDRDPKQPLKDEESGTQDWRIDMFWARNFYPSIYTLVNDLHSKGLIETGEYSIKIDW